MNNFTKLFLLGTMAMPMMTFADDGSVVKSDIKTQIQELRAEKALIKEQVANGEITKEAAKEIWAGKMEKIRAAKESAFTNKMDKLKAKFAERAEKNPEKAAEINARLAKITTFIETQRAEKKAFNESLKAKIQSGEITREEAKTLKKEKKAELKESRKAERAEAKESRAVERAEVREVKQAERKSEREDMKARVESGEITKEEAKAEREVKRAEVKEVREERLNEMKERNPERYEKAMERQVERKANRGEKREERKNRE